MTDRSTCLSNLSVGDIFHAEYPNGAKCICLVLSVNDSFIHAKRVTSQENLKVDRRSGIESDIGEKPLAVINSVAPLPAEFHDTFLELDRKYAAVYGQKDVLKKNPEYFKLTDAEKRALRFIDSHYASNLLPPPQS